MASISKAASGRYQIRFRIGGHELKRSLKTTNLRVAEDRLARLRHTLSLVKSGYLDLPEEGDVTAFLLSDGRLSTPVTIAKQLTLTQLFQNFEDNLPTDALEETTLTTHNVHRRHLLRLNGITTTTTEITLDFLQCYVNRRSTEKGIRDRCVSATTIKKEIATLRSVWNWAVSRGQIDRPFPGRHLRYPKTDEKPPFRTRHEIEMQISQHHLDDNAARDLWDCLYLDAAEIHELTDIVRDSCQIDFLYPMCITAAYTGARRSELVRSRREDVDLTAGMFIIRERKRDRTSRSVRSVPITDQLAVALLDWFRVHPGGPFTFRLPDFVSRSGKTRSSHSQITVHEATDHLKRTLETTRWNIIRGWHVFRHSFISNCASQGIDQRMIDAWVGHQTDAMRRRYMHLFPSSQRVALARVFASPEPTQYKPNANSHPSPPCPQ